MVRPTTKDLAIAAGVSLATVDRVLNDRPNVSNKSSQRVAQAIEDLGFVRNISAANLARSKTYRFRFVLPDSGDQYLDALLHQISDTNVSAGSESTVLEIAQLPIGDPHSVAKYLTTLDVDHVDGIAIMVPESPQVRDAIGHLCERGIQHVQFISGQNQQNAVDSVGVDNVAAGATAGRLIGQFNPNRAGQVLVIAETMQAQDSSKRRLGIDRIINEKFPGLCCLPSLETYADLERTNKIIERSFNANRDIVAVYVMSAEARIPISVIDRCADLKKLTVVVHERTPFTEGALRDEKVSAIIAQNPGHAVRSAVRILRARVDRLKLVQSQERIRIEVLFKENL